VNIADDIEGAMFVFFVIPEWFTGDFDGGDLVEGIEDINFAKSFAFESFKGAANILDVAFDYVWAKLSVWSILIAIATNLFG
jgi:hypothetical protein